MTRNSNRNVKISKFPDLTLVFRQFERRDVGQYFRTYSMDDETYSSYQFCIPTFGHTSTCNQKLFRQYDSMRRRQGHGLHEANHAIFDD